MGVVGGSPRAWYAHPMWSPKAEYPRADSHIHLVRREDREWAESRAQVSNPRPPFSPRCLLTARVAIGGRRARCTTSRGPFLKRRLKIGSAQIESCNKEHHWVHLAPKKMMNKPLKRASWLNRTRLKHCFEALSLCEVCGLYL